MADEETSDEPNRLTIELFMRNDRLTRQGMVDLGAALERNSYGIRDADRNEVREEAKRVLRESDNARERLRAMELIAKLDLIELERAERALDIKLKIHKAFAAEAEPETQTDPATMTDADLLKEFADFANQAAESKGGEIE